MKLSEWRPKFLLWLKDQIAVDLWTLDRPDFYTDTVGHLPPLRQVRFELEDPTRVTLEATQDFYIIRRYPSTQKFAELPLAELEGLYATLAIRLVHDYQDIDIDVLKLTFENVDNPVSVSEVGEDNGDWLLQLVWSFSIMIEAEPEVGTIQQPFDLKGISGGLWRTDLTADFGLGVPDLETRILDTTLKANKTT